MENTVLKKFREGQPSLGTFVAMGSPLAVESLRYTGLDYVIVDTEHTPAAIESAALQIQAAQGAGLTALARANEISRTAVLRLLDVGAQGIVVPCVETVDEVRDLVSWAKFAPLGNRGFCPTRDGGWGYAPEAASIPAYMDRCNRETLLLPQCETAGCLAHIEEICAMDGVDGIFVGPFDLSIALGRPGEFDAPYQCRNATSHLRIFVFHCTVEFVYDEHPVFSQPAKIHAIFSVGIQWMGQRCLQIGQSESHLEHRST